MLKGTGVAIVTPFLQGNIHWEGLERVVDHIIGGGAEYLVVLGTTGESVTLTPEERSSVLDFVVEKAAGRVPIVAGFGGNNTQQVVHQIENYHFRGVDAILSVGPYYNKPSQEGIFQHFMAIERASPVPIVIYNVPSRTACNISAETTLRLARESRKFIGVKEASGDMRQVMEIVRHRPDGFLVLSGDDLVTLPMLAFGIDGVISVVANAFPGPFSEMVRSGLSGDFTQAKRLHFELLPAMDLFFVDGNPAGVKAALELLGVCSREVRLPLVPVREETYRQLGNYVRLQGQGGAVGNHR
jgi:4-hydroxy-tetrahydrodipicolinate synthase